MRENLSEATVKATGITGTPIIARVPEFETKLGKKHRKAMNDMYGETPTTYLLDKNTMMVTLQGEFDRIYADTSIINKESTIREELLRPIALYTTSCNTSKLAKKCKSDENSEEALINIGEQRINDVVDMLPIKFDEESQKMCVWSLGNPKKNEPSKVMKYYSSYMKKFTKHIITFVNKNKDVDMKKDKKDVISLFGKGKRDYINERMELIGYATTQLVALENKKIKKNKKSEEVIKREVTEIFDSYYTASYDDPIKNNNGDSRTLLDILSDKRADFEDSVIDKVDENSDYERTMEIMKNTIDLIYKEAEIKAKRDKSNVNEEFEMYIALYNATMKINNTNELYEETKYNMAECLSSFQDIIEKYGETYSEISEIYKVRYNLTDISNSAISQQANNLKRKVEKELSVMYASKLKKSV